MLIFHISNNFKYKYTLWQKSFQFVKTVIYKFFKLIKPDLNVKSQNIP